MPAPACAGVRQQPAGQQAQDLWEGVVILVTTIAVDDGDLPVIPARESVFEKVADYVSAAMGRPLNIMVWFVLVIGWTALFAFGIVPANGSFLPRWFTSLGYNFPLNLVTTVAELFIGFLVAAAANRQERNTDITLARIERLEDSLQKAIRINIDLTQQVHDLSTQIHALVSGKGTT